MSNEVGIAPGNEEALEAWNGLLFDRFLEYRPLLAAGLEPHSENALRLLPPAEGDRALDIGCGFGDTTRRLAGLVGSNGSVLGVDIAPRSIELARREASAAGLENVRYEVRDVQAAPFEEAFDYAFSRFGVMFFADPVVALGNVRDCLAPGGRLCFVVWRRKLDNPWAYIAEQVVRPLLDIPDEQAGPGPFSMADADTVTGQLVSAGFEQIALHRSDAPFRLGGDLDEAVAQSMALGPAGAAIRLAGDSADAIRPQVAALLREALRPLETAEGIVASASTWVITASAPR